MRRKLILRRAGSACRFLLLPLLLALPALAQDDYGEEEYPCEGVLADPEQLAQTLAQVQKYRTTWVLVYADRIADCGSDRFANGRADRIADSDAHGNTNRDVHRHTDRGTHGYADRGTHSCTDRGTHSCANADTNRYRW